MKFAIHLKKKMVPEWRDAYISYQLLKDILKPFKITSKLYAKFHDARLTQSNLPPLLDMPEENKEDLDDLVRFENLFKELLFSEIEKLNNFFHLKMIETKKEWELIKMNCMIQRQYKIARQVDEDNKLQLKNCIFIIYKKINFLMEFLNLNMEATRKILKKHKKICKPFFSKMEVLDKKAKELFEKTTVYRNSELLVKVRDEVKLLYLDLYFNKFNKSKGHKELKDLTTTRIISVWESHFYFFFLGVSVCLLAVIIVLAVYGDIDPDDEETFKYIFPMFRGAAFIIFYFWLMGWNAYCWNRYYVNYKRIFKFNYHSSSVNEILKRATCFSSVFFITFIWFVLVNEKITNLQEYSFDKEFIPLILWASIILYMIAPFPGWFNFEGRKYFYRLMFKIFCLSFFTIDFIMAWATDQMVSFVTPLKDLEYTFCYYISRIQDSNNNHPKQCYQNTFIIGFMAAFVPVFYRMVQCSRSLYNKKKLIDWDLANFFKYFFTLMVAIFSYLLGTDPSNNIYLAIWIANAAISTIYSYSWDLKMDWGLLQPGSKNKYLRDKLIYPRKRMYYFIIIINLFLRLSWVFTISPGLVKKIMRPELFTLLTGSLEMFRRAMWNLIRVEKEFIANSENYQVLERYTLPYCLDKNSFAEEINSKQNMLMMQKSIGFERTEIEEKFIKNFKGKTSSDADFPLLLSFDDDTMKKRLSKNQNHAKSEDEDENIIKNSFLEKEKLDQEG